MKQLRLSAADQVSLSNALYAAASHAAKDALAFAHSSDDVPANPRLASSFAAQARAYRLLAERIDEAGAIILSDE